MRLDESIKPAAWVFAGTLLAMSVVAAAMGTTLGLFLAGLAICVVLVPWAVASGHRLDRQLLLSASVTDAIALVWLVGLLRAEQLGVLNWLGAYGVCLSVGLVQLGIVRLLAPLGPSVSAGISVLFTIAWLITPVWMFPHLSQHLMQGVIDLHPLFAMNSSVPLSVWTESPIAYRLLNLNQDVYYAMPASPIKCVIVHAATGAGLIWVKARVHRSPHTK